MRSTILLPLLMFGALAATPAKLLRAADTLYRSGDFERATVEMTSCVGYELVKRHPQLHYFTGKTAAVSWSVAWSTSTRDFIWAITAKPTGPTSSHVELRNKEAQPAEILEVWQVIEGCMR